MKKPKILLYDIETSPNLAYVWGKYQQDVVAYKNERRILSVAYRWLGDRKIEVISTKGVDNDYKLVSLFATILNEADICIAHNGDHFDRTIVKTRMLYHGMKPLKINCSVDTLKVVKTYFNFNGNSLADVCHYLKIGKKTKHPGIDMWMGCLANDARSWAQMVKYNKQDVVLLTKLYNRLRPWIENHPNVARLLGQCGCPSCANTQTSKYGIRPTARGLQQRWLCRSCGRHWTTPMGAK
jgi:DNA polymerase elongation subunit (family B)